MTNFNVILSSLRIDIKIYDAKKIDRHGRRIGDSFY